MRASALLLLRGIRWRLGISLLTVLTSAMAVGAAALGPLYLQTAGDSVVRTTLASAPIENRGITVSAASGQSASLDQIESAERTVVDSGGRQRWFSTPITSVLSGVTITRPRSGPVRAQLFSRTGICGVVHFQAGGCNLGLGDVAISSRSAQELGVSMGAVLNGSVAGASKPLPLTITGIYSLPNFELPYWWGGAAGDFPFGQTSGVNPRLPAIDSLISSPATALSVPVQDSPQITGQVPLRVASVGLSQERSVRAALSRATGEVATQGIALNSQLPTLLTGADAQRHVMATIVAVAAIQLVVLAIWILAGQLIRSSDARRAEIRVARLRGFPLRSLLNATALEPTILCGLGFLIGVGAAWGADVVARDELLDQSATVSPNGWVFAALGVSALAILGSVGISTLRLLRASGLSAPPATRAKSRPTTYIMDALLLVLSVVAIIALATNGSLSGHSNPIASAAPGLIALGTAVIAVQLVLFVCRLGVLASVNSDRIAVFLALRQIVRRPAVLRQTRVLVIALGLACFAISAWSVARTNRASAATFSVGATRVATVRPGAVGLEQAVNRVDPHRRFAMAVVAVNTPSSTLLAVDATRLGAVLPWPSGISRSGLAKIASRLRPPTAPVVTLPAAPIRLLARSTFTGSSAGMRNLQLSLWVFSPTGGTLVVELGGLHAGLWTYHGSLGALCPGSCRLVGVGLVPGPGRSAPTSGSVQLSVTGAEIQSAAAAWTPVPADLSPREWRATATGVQIRQVGQAGLTLVVPAAASAAYTGAVGFATPPMVSVADHPTVLPGVVTTELQSLNAAATTGGVVPAQGLDGNTLSVSSAATASALPRAGGNASMVDLDLLSRTQVDPTSPYAVDQVWLGPSAPPDALARLQSAGLHVESVETASAVFHRLEQSAPALADDFLLVATILALFAAAASTLGTLGANTRERATELTTLEVGGVPRRMLAGSLAVETAVLAVTALFGAGAGVLAAIMAIPALPELGTAAPVPLHYGLPGGWLAAVSLAVIGAVMLAGAVVAAIVVHRMSPLLLRMAPNDSTG